MMQIASEEHQHLPTNDLDRQQATDEALQNRGRTLNQKLDKRKKLIICFIGILVYFFYRFKLNAPGTQSILPQSSNSQTFKSDQKLKSDPISNQQEASIMNKNQSFNVSSQSFNLWDLTKAQKMDLLRIYSQYYHATQPYENNSKPMNILNDSNIEASKYLKEFDQHSEQIKWNQTIMSKQDEAAYEKDFNKLLESRNKKIQSWLKKFADYEFDDSLVSPTRNITKSQFYKGIKYHQISGKAPYSQAINKIYQDEKAQFEQKYQLKNYQKELRACVIVPTFNNVRDNRYLWNIQSILQQQYQNLKVIIIDDASADGTSNKIGKHLQWRKADPNKYVLIKSSIRKKSLYSFYYGAHKYCDLGEIIYTIDGDDELIGTQVFKLINAIYLKQKPYTLYSIFIINHPDNLTLANNHQYSLEIKSKNKYRWDKSHGYSHLRTMLSDTFLLVNSSSFKPNNDNKFFQLITDSAVYFCAMELSCQKVRFLEELNYWYHYNTENNIFKQMTYKKYQTFVSAVEAKKPYKCIHDYFIEAEKWHKAKS